MRCAKRRYCDELGVRSDRIVVTTCDADTYFHQSHFSALSAAYCSATSKQRRRTFWQACTQFYPNCDQVPTLCSVRYALLSVGFLGQMSNPLHYRLPFAVYSLALDLAVEAHYWDPSVIPEDWHMFLRCFYATRGGVKVDPIFLPVGCECVVDTSATKTIGACYDQAKRWQWGAIDVDLYQHDYEPILKQIHKLKLPLIMFRSKSGGAHLYIFLSEPISATEIRDRLAEFASALGYGNCEIFPKQEEVIVQRGDVGNFINLPYFNYKYTMRYAITKSGHDITCLLYTSPSPRDQRGSRMASSA